MSSTDETCSLILDQRPKARKITLEPAVPTGSFSACVAVLVDQLCNIVVTGILQALYCQLPAIRPPTGATY